MPVTSYGSQFAAGLRSSKNPHLSASTDRGIRTEHPRCAIYTHKQNKTNQGTKTSPNQTK